MLQNNLPSLPSPDPNPSPLRADFKIKYQVYVFYDMPRQTNFITPWVHTKTLYCVKISDYNESGILEQ